VRAAVRWISVGRLGLTDAPYEGATGAEELVATLLSGAVTAVIGDAAPQTITGRADVFGAGPTLICVPPATTYRLTSVTPTADLVLFTAPAEPGAGGHIVRPADAPARSVGAGNWTRTVWPGTGTNATTCTPGAWNIARLLEATAGLSGAEGHPLRAARLLGAADALREAVGARVPGYEREGVTRDLEMVRAAVPAAAFAAAFAEGRALGTEQAIEDALKPAGSSP